MSLNYYFKVVLLFAVYCILSLFHYVLGLLLLAHSYFYTLLVLKFLVWLIPYLIRVFDIAALKTIMLFFPLCNIRKYGCKLLLIVMVKIYLTF